MAVLQALWAGCSEKEHGLGHIYFLAGRGALQVLDSSGSGVSTGGARKP